MEEQLTPIIKDGFLQFAGAVLQSRALVDARDCIKPSARQIFYCMYTDNFVHSKPFQKTLKAIGSAFRLYIHGDASAEGVIMRAAQPFAMRYPLVEVEGSYGTLLASGSWAAPRYTSSRLTPLAEYLFKDIKKDTIADWRDNYDNTEQYPAVLPSKGFTNLVNGSYGIGVGASSSIPQYNLKELNEALIKLLWNPDIDFEDIYVAPDFATGGILLNADEVKESHRNGTGKACKIRSVIEYDSKERCLVVKEIPYMLYTETICKQLEDIINGENNPGIDRFNDLTGKEPLIKIYLMKQATPERVLKYLYKNTELQSYYGVNFTVLDNGRFPKVFTWKEMLQAHLDHEKEVYIRGYKYDLNKIEDRLHIIEGLLICMARIEEVVTTIKSSASTSTASTALQEKFLLDAVQAKAVLDMKLSRLAHLEVDKLEGEKSELEDEAKRIKAILESEELLKKEIEKGLREVANKFGDSRRTQILNLKADGDEVIEEKNLIVGLTNFSNIFISESSTLMTQKRGGTGSKIKLANGEYVIESFSDSNQGTLMLFSNKGRYYSAVLGELQLNTITSIYDILNLQEGETITKIISYNKAKDYKYIVFMTKEGLIKKSNLEEYKSKRSSGAQGIKLKDNDEIVDICFMNDEPLGVLTKKGQFVIFETKEINPLGKVASGVKGITLNSDDVVVCARPIKKEAKEIVSVTSNGIISKTAISEFNITGRGTKGVKIQKLNEGDSMAGFIPIYNSDSIIIAATSSIIKFSANSIPCSLRGSLGVHGIKLKSKDKVIDLIED